MREGQGDVSRDEVVIFEVMTGQFNREWWSGCTERNSKSDSGKSGSLSEQTQVEQVRMQLRGFPKVPKRDPTSFPNKGNSQTH